MCQIPNRKLVDHLMEKIRTNTAPPEPSHPFTTNCDTTGYARKTFLSNHKVHFVDDSHNLGGTELVQSFRLHSAYPIATVWRIITSTNKPQNFVHKNRISYPQLEPVDRLVKRTRTDTGPPEPSHSPRPEPVHPLRLNRLCTGED